MRVAVCLKEVIDARLPVNVEPKSAGVKLPNVNSVTTLNPADRCALEAAMQLRQEMTGTRVEAFMVGDASHCGALYFARARGADYVERLDYSFPLDGSPFTAALLATRFTTEKFNLICCGDETLDNSSAMVGPLIAEMLDLPQVTNVVSIHSFDQRHLLVERNLDHGNRELVEMDLPGLITLRPEGIETTYVSFRRLQDARRQEIPVQICEYEDGYWQLPLWPERQARIAPRARVKKSFTPDPKLSPAERVRLIMAGGMGSQESKSKSSIIEGDAEYVSEQLYRFLKHHEFL